MKICKFWAALICAAALRTQGARPATVRTFFSPNDNIAHKLIWYIDHARHRIWAAVYNFTDIDIAEALVRALNRGVDVQVITDQLCLKKRSGQAQNLSDAKILTFIFNSDDAIKKRHIFPYQPLMHNKFAVIDGIVWQGSYNWTFSADKANRESVVVIEDDYRSLCEFCNEFAVIRASCNRLLPTQHVDFSHALAF
ncbi:phospholipase D-like domain-containing protein [Candidatus Dependentiae bacterium]